MASKQKFVIEAEVRHDIGKGASRRLRREEKVPSVVYGGGKDAASLSIAHKAIAKALESEAFYSQIITLKADKETDRVILKDVQRHPFKPRILHVDFQRVRADEKLHLHIPLHFIGEEDASSLKGTGALISHIMTDVEIACLPDNLPEYIEVDLSKLQLNQTLHLSDLTLPKGVELVALAHGDDKAVVSAHLPRVQEEAEVTEAPTASEVPATAQKAEGEA